MATDSSSAKEAKPPADDKDDIINQSLFRLTQGLPRRELALIVSEADECIASIEQEINLLEKAAKNPDAQLENKEEEEKLQFVLESLLTPMDSCWTASALVGRLRGEQAVPRIPTAATLLPPPPPRPPSSVDDPSLLLSLTQHPNYTKVHENPNALLALYKRISLHRSSSVFKRPVKPEDAPGYTDRIKFPMDLSLVRKLIVSKSITTYQQFHERLGLIVHNCVKFNGRDSDYGLVARDFEATIDEFLYQAVCNVPRTTPTPTAIPTTPTSERDTKTSPVNTSMDTTEKTEEMSTEKIKADGAEQSPAS